MSQGTVKWYNPRKGYGFIKVDGQANDVFVHSSEVRYTGFHDQLHENQRVEFEIGQGQKGPAAKNVRLIE